MKALIQMTIDTERTEGPKLSVDANGADMRRVIIDARSYEEASGLIQEAIQQAENAIQEYTAPEEAPEGDPVDPAESIVYAPVTMGKARAYVDDMKEWAARNIREIEKAEAFTQEKGSSIDLITGRYLMMLGYTDNNGAVLAYIKSYALGFMRGFRKAKREQKAKEGK